MNSYNNFSLSHCNHEVCDAFGPSACPDYDNRAERKPLTDDGFVDKPERDDTQVLDVPNEEGGVECSDVSTPDTDPGWDAGEANDRFAC